MSEGEFKKRLNRKYTNYTTEPPYQYYRGVHTTKAIETMIDEAKQDLFDCFRRGLIHTGLVKWFGAEDSKPSRVYSELELKKMAYGIPIDTKETSKTE